MTELVVVAHNIRSTHNVGAIFRTAEGMGVSRLMLSGYTPAPHFSGDTRLPHIADKLHAQIHKTALSAEEIVPFEYHESPPLDELKSSGYRIAALEQAETSTYLASYKAPKKLVLLLGEEVEGINEELLGKCDDILEIPMRGQKESYNVSVAAGIAMDRLLN